MGINDTDQIVGQYWDGSSSLHGFLDTNGTFTTLDEPLAVHGYNTGTYTSDVNNAGQVVGYYWDASGKLDGFVDINGTYTTINVPGATNTLAWGINNSGDIVGFYSDASGTHAFLATPNGATTDGAPLPVTGGTLPGAVVLLGWLGRRIARRRNA